MNLKKLSFRTRIFLAMILLVLMASVLISAVAIYQYKEQSSDYHSSRLERKEKNIQTHLKRFLNGRYNTWEIKTENLPLIFKDEIYNVANIHRLQINLYDLEGNLLLSSKAGLLKNVSEQCLDAEILNTINNTVQLSDISKNAEHRYVHKLKENGETFQSSYTFLLDKKSNPLAILKLPYLDKVDFLEMELKEF